jgi:hypothetical protein
MALYVNVLDKDLTWEHKASIFTDGIGHMVYSVSPTKTTKDLSLLSSCYGIMVLILMNP